MTALSVLEGPLLYHPLVPLVGGRAVRDEAGPVRFATVRDGAPDRTFGGAGIGPR